MKSLVNYAKPIVLIQIVTALLSFIGSFYILTELNVEYLGKISFEIGVSILAYTMSSLGGGELIQKKYAESKLLEISFNLIKFQVLVSAVFLIAVGMLYDSLSILNLIMCFFYIHTMLYIEVISRFKFQDGYSFKGQAFISLPVLAFWLLIIISIYLDKEINTFFLMLIGSILSLITIIFFDFSNFKLIKIKRIDLLKGSWFSVYSTRINSVVLDWLPVLFFSYMGNNFLSGVYALISKIYMPLIIIMNAIVTFFVKQTLSLSMSFKMVFYYLFIYSILLCLIMGVVVIVFYKNMFNLVNQFSLEEVTVLTFFILLLYRVSYLAYLFSSQAFIKIYLSCSKRIMFFIYIMIPLIMFFIILLMIALYGESFITLAFFIPLFFLALNLLVCAKYLFKKVKNENTVIGRI